MPASQEAGVSGSWPVPTNSLQKALLTLGRVDTLERPRHQEVHTATGSPTYTRTRQSPTLSELPSIFNLLDHGENNNPREGKEEAGWEKAGINSWGRK